MTRRRLLTRIVLIGVPAAIALYALVGFFGVPLLISKVLLPRLSENLHGRATAQTVRCNPFKLTVTLEGLEVVDEAGKRLVACDRAYANLQVSTLWRGGPHLKIVTLDRPFIDAELQADGRLNLIELVKDQPDEPEADPDEEPWRLSFEKLQISNGRVEFADFTLPEPFEAVVEPLNVDFADFDTDPANQNAHRFTAQLASGGTLAWEGDFFLDPLSSEGRFVLTDLSLPHYRPYLRRLTDVRVAEGLATITLRYRFAPVRTPRLAEVTLERSELKGLKLVRGEEPLLELPEAVLQSGQIDAANRGLTLGGVDVKRARLRVTRLPDGTFPIERALRGDVAPPQAEPNQVNADATDAAAEALNEAQANTPQRSPITRVVEATLALLLEALNPWSVQTERMVLEDATLEFRDLAAPEPVTVVVDRIRLAAGPVRSDERYRVPIDLACRINDTGSLTVKGDLGLEDRTALLDLALSDLGLPSLAPYMKTALPEATLTSGRFGIAGKADAALPEAGPSLKFTGELGVHDLRVDSSTPEEPLVAWAALAVRGIDFDHAARSARVAEVVLDAPKAAYTLQPGEEQSDEPEEEDTIQYAFHADTIRVNGGELLVTDPRVQPAARVPLTALAATITNVATEGDAVAGVEASGTLQGSASFKATGSLKPDPEAPFLDLAVEVQGLSLPPFTGYAGKYVGFTIDRGKLTTRNQVKLENDQLDANVSINLDAFYLGEKVESPDAPNLPVKLALGLLRDRNEQINLEVPITGNLADPTISVGHLLRQAIVNTITRIATSPFDFIAGAFGGGGGNGGSGGRKLDAVAFAPGSDALSKEAMESLDVVARALRERPGLNVAVRGGFDADADGPVVRKALLMDQIRRQIAATLPADDPARAEPATLQPTDEEYLGAITRRFEAIREGITDPVKLAEAGAPPPAPEKRVVRGGRGGGHPEQAEASVPLPIPLPLPWPRDREKPAERPATDAPGEPGMAEPAPADSATQPAVPLAEMEARVVAAFPLPDDALPALADRRAEAVVTYLTQAGAIEPERATADTTGEPAAGSQAKLELR